jgi:hypothetical protein
MIPKVYSNENGFQAIHPLHLAAMGGVAIPPGFIPNFIPENAVIHQNSSEIDYNVLQTHRRKMLRRAANRRSAQLSRARKKVTVFLK